MIVTRDDILKRINELANDDSNDSVISLIEDVSDTFSDYDGRLNDTTNWREQYEENDKEWRRKYKERFLNNEVDVEDPKPDFNNDDENHPTKFEELFIKEDK